MTQESKCSGFKVEAGYHPLWLLLLNLWKKNVIKKSWPACSPGLPRAHPESYHSYMWNNFFKHIDIDPANAHILDGNAEDLDAECQAYEQKISVAGGIELFVGGQTHGFLLHVGMSAVSP